MRMLQLIWFDMYCSTPALNHTIDYYCICRFSQQQTDITVGCTQDTHGLKTKSTVKSSGSQRHISQDRWDKMMTAQLWEIYYMNIPESSQSFDSTSFFKCGTLALTNYISTLDIYLLFYVIHTYVHSTSISLLRLSFSLVFFYLSFWIRGQVSGTAGCWMQIQGKSPAEPRSGGFAQLTWWHWHSSDL